MNCEERESALVRVMKNSVWFIANKFNIIINHDPDTALDFILENLSS